MKGRQKQAICLLFLIEKQAQSEHGRVRLHYNKIPDELIFLQL